MDKLPNPFTSTTDFIYEQSNNAKGELNLFAYGDGSISIEVDRGPYERGIIFLDGDIARQAAEWILERLK